MALANNTFPPVFPPVLSLPTVNGDNGIVIRGIDLNDQSGWSVSNAGDVNGDQVDDLIIGAIQASTSYVVYGSTDPFSRFLDLNTLTGSNGFAITGEPFIGRSVSGIGDFNGDGFDDVIVANPNAGDLFQQGENYVVFGKGTPFPPSIDSGSLGGSDGFAIIGEQQGDFAGASVSGAGDINGDGFDDLVIGASSADPNGVGLAGAAYVVFGTSTPPTSPINVASLNGSNGFVLNGVQLFDMTGTSVSEAGDINGDGIDDLVIGTRGRGPNDDSANRTYVVFGTRTPFSAELDLADLNGANGFTINGIGPRDEAGAAVSGAGDINGDGIDDLIIGARRASPNSRGAAGESYVVFGQTAPFDANLDLVGLDGSNGFAVAGAAASSQSGYSVSAAGDLNGDGIDDLVIGAPFASPNSVVAAGEAYVVFGKGSPFPSSLDAANLDPSEGFRLTGARRGGNAGWSVTGAGDFNGDGIDDLVIGVPNANGRRGLSGRTYVVFGRIPEPTSGVLIAVAVVSAANTRRMPRRPTPLIRS
ncbi:MAG: integrin alpha [Planctomycetota bacterium]